MVEDGRAEPHDEQGVEVDVGPGVRGRGRDSKGIDKPVTPAFPLPHTHRGAIPRPLCTR